MAAKSTKGAVRRRNAGQPPTAGRRRNPPVRAIPEDANPQNRRALTLPDEVVEEALRTGSDPGLMEELFGPAGHAELRVLAREAAVRAVRGGARVLILPGIMGSKLGYDGDTLWLDPIDFAALFMQRRQKEARPHSVN